MTRIDGLPGPPSAAGARRVAVRAPDGGVRFVVTERPDGAEPPGMPDAAGEAAPMQGLAALLAIQETTLEPGVDAVARRRDQAARQRGQDLLGALGRLQRAMLGADGAGLGDSRAVMRNLLDGLPDAADPVLAGIVHAIALRARVELARAE
ncbi:MAG: hypothetical protein JSR21_11805 [Proteobacteria bacterium]|nr:hypothetical protein [Pseudomonadota bacterium]